MRVWEQPAHSAARAVRVLRQRPPSPPCHGLYEMREGVSAYFVWWGIALTNGSQKLSKLAAPDPFTSSYSSIKNGSRVVGENKLSKKNRYTVRGGPTATYPQKCTHFCSSHTKGNVRTANSPLHRIPPSIAMVRPPRALI